MVCGIKGIKLVSKNIAILSLYINRVSKYTEYILYREYPYKNFPFGPLSSHGLGIKTCFLEIRIYLIL